MGITSEFIKSRSSGSPKPGVWNENFSKTRNAAKTAHKILIACWSNGDNCGYCKAAEECMMQKAFTDWMKKSDCYFAFQYSGDASKGKDVHDWVYDGKGGLKYYPGFRITMYDAENTKKIVFNKYVEGNTLRENLTGAAGAKKMVANLKKIIAKCPVEPDYKIRFNESLTVKQVNAILDSIDKNGGYCPCQPKADGTKCHCTDFVNNKKIGEPCICTIYVKQKID